MSSNPIPNDDWTDEDDRNSNNVSKDVNASYQLFRWYHFVLLLCLLVSIHAGNMAQYTITSQYIYHRYSIDAHLPGGGKNNNGSMCNQNVSDPDRSAQEQVQHLSSQMTMFSSVAQGIPALFTVFICGTYSDRLGRRITILMSWGGLLLQGVLIALMIFLEWPVWVYPIASIFGGLGGGYGGMVSGVFAFLADTTSSHQRNIAISAFEASISLSGLLSQFFVGWWIRLSGFLDPFLGMTGLLLTSVFYLTCLPETAPRCTRSRRFNPSSEENTKALLNPLTVLKLGLQLFTQSRSRAVLLGLCLFAFFIHISVYIGHMGVITIYLLSEPFCWDSVGLGYFRGASTATVGIGLIVIVFLFRKWVKDICFVEGGFFFFTINFLLIALASQVPQDAMFPTLYTSVAVGLFTGLCVPLIRSIMSKLVSKDEQGVLFSSMAMMETLGIMLGGVVLNAIYQATLSVMFNFVFIFAAVLTGLGGITMGIFHYKYGQYQREDSQPLLFPISTDIPVV